MSRKDRKPKHQGKKREPGLQLRLTVGLILLFAAALVLTNVVVSGQIERQCQEQIQGNLRDLKSTAEIYTRQLLVTNRLNNEEEGFREAAEEVLDQLISSGQERVAAYTPAGELITSTQSGLFEDGYDEDYRTALGGQSAFTLIHGRGSTLTVRFSCPMVIEGKTVGMLRFDQDYSQWWRQWEGISRLVLLVTLIVFALTLLIMLGIARALLRPVLLLSRHSTRVSREIEQGDWSAQAEVLAPPRNLQAAAGRRDELGQLADNYLRMLEALRRQLERIGEDRDRIRDLYREKQDFFNNATHELKTPLTTISGYAELIGKNGGRDPELLQKGARHIEEESRRLHALVVNLLEMSDRTEKEAPKSCDFSALVRSAAEGMEPKARRYGCRFELRIEDNVCLTGRPDRLRELAVNLLDNAIKYGEPGGAIGVQLNREPDGFLCFAVTNGGPGMTEQQLEQVFSPFYRAASSRERGSAGLGLSICRKITEEHGGTITAQSVPGVSTVFTVRLPLTDNGMEGKEEHR